MKSNDKLCLFGLLNLIFLSVVLCNLSTSSINSYKHTDSNLKENSWEKRKLKILVTSASIGWSHLQFQGKLADILVEAGHEVHIFTFNMTSEIQNYTGSKKSHKVHRHVSKMQIASFDLGAIFNGMKNFIYNGVIRQLFLQMYDHCEEILSTNQKIIQNLEAEHFDVAIAEVYDLCSFGLYQKIGVKTKLASTPLPFSSAFGRGFGIPYFTNFFCVSPNVILNKIGFVERFHNFITHELESWTTNIVPEFNALFQNHFGKNFPLIESVTRNISLVFVNSNEFLTLPKAISHKIIYVGGITQSKTVKPLNKEIKEIIENAKDGVFLISFGTMANPKQMSDELLDTFFNAIKTFPTYNFIWKFYLNENQAAKQPSNLHVFKWVDQISILNHPKLKAFITHAGLNSANEAAQAGIPVIAIPLLFDQSFNAASFIQSKSGVIIDITKLLNNPSYLVNAINEVLANSFYKSNAKILKLKFDSTPFNPRERFVRWVEFASQFPELNELNLPMPEEMGLIAYYNLDVIFVICFLFVIVISLTIFLLRILFKILTNITLIKSKLD